MSSGLRVVTWNCRRASTTSHLWDYLLELNPDIALLQDFGSIPKRVLDAYAHAANRRSPAADRAPRHMSGVLLRAGTALDLDLPAPAEWVAQELDTWAEYFTAKVVTLPSGAILRVMSVYSPAFPVDRARMELVDTAGIQLTQNRDVWGTELMWATLKAMDVGADDPFLVGGDLNSSESLDWSASKPRGNLEVMERMNALGCRDCLRAFTGQLTPTFRSPRGELIHQLDHLYATAPLSGSLTQCRLGSAERVLQSNPSLSDHLPIVADFDCA